MAVAGEEDAVRRDGNNLCAAALAFRFSDDGRGS
jgi:hypothetical protein